MVMRNGLVLGGCDDDPYRAWMVVLGWTTPIPSPSPIRPSAPSIHDRVNESITMNEQLDQ